jgi:hypothetical protein
MTPLRETLKELSLLEDNWDGYEALAPSPESVITAARVIDHLEALGVPVVPDLVPKSNGTLAFIWDTPPRDTYLEVGRSGFASYVHTARDTRMSAGLVSDLTQEFIQKLYAYHQGVQFSPGAFS